MQLAPTLHNSYSAILYKPFVHQQKTPNVSNLRELHQHVQLVAYICNCAAVGHPPVNYLVVSGLRPSQRPQRHHDAPEQGDALAGLACGLRKYGNRTEILFRCVSRPLQLLHRAQEGGERTPAPSSRETCFWRESVAWLCGCTHAFGPYCFAQVVFSHKRDNLDDTVPRHATLNKLPN